MPVYLATVHSYRSWREDHPRGYVQRGVGWMPTDGSLAGERADRARQAPNRFELIDQHELHVVSREIADEREVRLHGCATTPTHVHQLVSFQSPACQCVAHLEHCFKVCAAYQHVASYLTRYKRIGGFRLAKLNETRGRIWFSAGWHISPVKGRKHFGYLMQTYLPKHVREAGFVEIYD